MERSPDVCHGIIGIAPLLAGNHLVMGQYGTLPKKGEIEVTRRGRLDFRTGRTVSFPCKVCRRILSGIVTGIEQGHAVCDPPMTVGLTASLHRLEI